MMVDAMHRAKANIRYTTYPDLAHNCWDETYKNPGLYRWFLHYQKGGTESNYSFNSDDESQFKIWESNYALESHETAIQQHENFDLWARN
jgi:hypothetical protein